MESLKAIRIPLYLIGLALIFATERYLKVYDWKLYALGLGWVFALVPVLIAWLMQRKAQTRGLQSEASSWRYLVLWKAVVLLGVAVYHAYRWQLGTASDPGTLLGKLLLVAWLSLVVLGLAAGIGIELAHRTNGEGEVAEPARLRWSGTGWLAIGLLLGGLVALNFTAAKKNKIFDVSYFKTSKPGESTLKIAASLDAPVKVGLFFSKDSEVLPFVRDYLETVAKQNREKIELGIFDKDFHPLQAEEYRVSRNGQIVLSRDGRRQRIDLGDKLENARRKLRTLDMDFQKALLGLTEEGKNIYFTTTHGEMSWSLDKHSPLRSLRALELIMRAQNLTPRTLTTAFSSIPDDATAVAVIGPISSLSSEEVSNIRSFLDKGGKLWVALDIESGGERPEGIEVGDQAPLLQLLQEMGVEYDKQTLINDREFVNAGRDSRVNKMFLFSNVFGSHESVTTLTRNDDKLSVLMFQLGSFVLGTPSGEWKPVATILSTKSSFIDKNQNFSNEPDEPRNSFPLAVAVEKPVAEGKKAQVVVLADSTMLSDALMGNNGNQFAALDILRWLSDRMDTAGAIESEEDVKIQHSKSRELFVFHGSIFTVPLFIIVLGFIVNRRKRGRV
jgi:hypothetical protein